MAETFVIEKPRFNAQTGEAVFPYRLGDLAFTERLVLPLPAAPLPPDRQEAFALLLDLTAAVLGVSYYKLRAPFEINATALSLLPGHNAFLIDVYENGLGEFYARNDLERFGKLSLSTGPAAALPARPVLEARALVPIGGGKDSLVSLDLLERAGAAITLFAVNPKGPIVTSAARAGEPMLAVSRVLDPEMIRLGKQPGFYNGHVPSTAIVSMIASLTALLHGLDAIVLSNERSASEGNLVHDGREVNHQYSKSLAFESRISRVLSDATGGALAYFSLLRPYSEARIAALFARTTRFDDVFSSCNENFKLTGSGPQSLWCGRCPKCHFVALIMAPVMPPERLVAIQGRNVLDEPENLDAFRELTGLVGHKPWECVGEILEAAACLYRAVNDPRWSGFLVVKTLKPELEAFYGAPKLLSAYDELLIDSPDHLIPETVSLAVTPHAD